MILTKEILCKNFQHVFHFHPISSALIFQAWVSGISEGKGDERSKKKRQGRESNLSSLLPCPPSPCEISSPLTPKEGLILRLSFALFSWSWNQKSDYSLLTKKRLIII